MAEGKSRYPTKNGLPVIPRGLGECYDECRLPDPGVNKHHLLWPRDKYRQAIERQARECGSMVVMACKCKHSDLHATYNPPPMPDRFTMIDVAAGDIVPVVSEVFIRER